MEIDWNNENGRYVSDDTFKVVFFDSNLILIKTSLNFVPDGPVRY